MHIDIQHASLSISLIFQQKVPNSYVPTTASSQKAAFVANNLTTGGGGHWQPFENHDFFFVLKLNFVVVVYDFSLHFIEISIFRRRLYKKPLFDTL